MLTKISSIDSIRPGGSRYVYFELARWCLRRSGWENQNRVVRALHHYIRREADGVRLKSSVRSTKSVKFLCFEWVSAEVDLDRL